MLWVEVGCFGVGLAAIQNFPVYIVYKDKNMPFKGHKRGRNYFQRGHKPYTSLGHQYHISEPEQYRRMDFNTYSLGLNLQDQPPSSLRPRPHQGDQEPFVAVEELIGGNQIVSMDILADVMSSLYASHMNASPDCASPCFSFPRKLAKNQGLGISVTVVCQKCQYTSSKYDLYSKLCTGKPGKPPADINIRCGQYMASSEVSLNSMSCLLAILNCHVPDQKTLQRNICKASNAHLSLAEAQINKNRGALAEIITHMDDNSPVKGIVAMDTMYNNPSRGGNYLPGTQSCTPIVEMTTKKQMIIGMECKSQICSKRKTRQELLCSHSGHCSQTYPAGKPLSDVEKIASQNFFSSIEQGPLANKITHVLADGCNQVLSGVNNPGIERLLCSQHLKRGQWRKFYSMAALLSPSLFGTVDPSGRKWELGSSIINRCSAEMTMFHKLHKKDENAYLSAMEKVRLGILPCLSGDHRQCRNTLSMCPMHPASSSAARNPKTKLRNFALDSSDIKVLQEVVDYRWAFPALHI